MVDPPDHAPPGSEPPERSGRPLPLPARLLGGGARGARRVAQATGIELPLASEMKALLRAAMEAGYADQDFMALFLYLRSLSGRQAPLPLSGMGGHSDQEVVR